MLCWFLCRDIAWLTRWHDGRHMTIDLKVFRVFFQCLIRVLVNESSLGMLSTVCFCFLDLDLVSFVACQVWLSICIFGVYVWFFVFLWLRFRAAKKNTIWFATRLCGCAWINGSTCECLGSIQQLLVGFCWLKWQQLITLKSNLAHCFSCMALWNWVCVVRNDLGSP